MTQQIPGVPEGWELVEFRQPNQGDWVINWVGQIERWNNCVSAYVFPIIRKIERPAKYRPFADAEEFRPHRDRWTMHPNEPDKRFRTGDYNNDGVWGSDRRFYSFKDLFESGALFDDGTPFGVKIDE